MVRSLNQIEQEMAALQETVASIAGEFHDAYGQYLDALGQAVRQQLILASYHLCTHGYPDAFLSLTFNQRQELQQQLRQLSQQAQDDIANHLQPIVPRDLSGQQLMDDSEEEEDDEEDEEEEDEELDLDEAIDRSSITEARISQDFGDMDLPTALRFIQKAMASQRSESEDSQSEPSPPDTASEQPQSDDPQIDNLTPDTASENVASDPLSIEPPEAASNESGEESDKESDDRFAQPPQADRPTDSSSEQPPIEDRPLTPKDLLYWQDRTEKAIMAMLYELSHAANRMLHRAKVLPNQLPEPILEVAAKSEMSAETMASPPNLLSLMIEARPEGSKRSTMTPIVVVRLRLSEIEFANSSVSVWRSRIRELSARLSKVGRDYYQKQKERSVAQAEAAWRSSWYEG
ncbi:hypothetical protein [Leptolyngbya ohadii]|uniref:hypothetical protein n=1 Tax=Leptolyngbya ohadii TaxID=1962290 RepID=UPI0015C65667|nr:hypothetical protein [Leptolyngbya ohadii]